jgi:hypothetical protein
MFDGVLDETRFGFYNIEAAFIKKKHPKPDSSQAYRFPETTSIRSFFYPPKRLGNGRISKFY